MKYKINASIECGVVLIQIKKHPMSLHSSARKTGEQYCCIIIIVVVINRKPKFVNRDT